jgi:hypothetical protein
MNKPIIRGYSLHILQGMDAHIIVQPEATTFLYQAYPFDLPFPIYYTIHYHNTRITKPLTHERIQMAEQLDPNEMVSITGSGIGDLFGGEED